MLLSEEREEREKRRKRHHAGPTGHVAVLRVLLLHGDIVHGACVLMSCQVGFVEYFVRMTAHPTRRLRIEGSGNAYVTASRRAVVWQHMLERGGT